MPFEKGREKTGGRPPGGLNKTTAALKQALDTAFEEVGGSDYFVKIARTDPRTFCGLLGKLLPAELKLEGGDSGLPLVIVKSYCGMSDAQVAAADAAKAEEDAAKAADAAKEPDPAKAEGEGE